MSKELADHWEPFPDQQARRSQKKVADHGCTPGTRVGRVHEHAWVRSGSNVLAFSLMTDAALRITADERSGKLLKTQGKHMEPVPPPTMHLIPLQTVVRLMPGENRIRAVAVGVDGVESKPAMRVTTLAGPRLPPNLNVLAIGINDYANPAWELFYPRNDAETLVSALRYRGTRLLAENGRPAFASVRAQTLLDRSAHRNTIESLIARSETDAQDVLVLYFAGHGYALEGERGWDWYLLPYTREWRRQTDSPEEFEDLIREHGLSARHLMSLLTRTPAQRVFLVLDSCYSGAVVEAVEGLVAPSPVPGDDAATQKALRQIARIGGLHVLAASRAHEKATELQLEPHGALTYLVLEGVRGEADTDGDMNVTVREIINYATVEMPNLADKLSQQPISQKPLGYSRGANFTVAGLRQTR